MGILAQTLYIFDTVAGGGAGSETRTAYIDGIGTMTNGFNARVGILGRARSSMD